MAAAKTARSRGTPVKETGAKFEEGISFFRSDKFDADSYVQTRCSLNEKVRFIYPSHFTNFFLSFQVFCVYPFSVRWGLHVIAMLTCFFLSILWISAKFSFPFLIQLVVICCHSSGISY